MALVTPVRPLSGAIVGSGGTCIIGSSPPGEASPTASSHSPSAPLAAHLALFARLVDDPFMSDVTLLVRNGEAEGDAPRRVHAHRVILGAVSPTFRAMFDGGHFVEATATTIDVPYEYATCFRAVLDFIYSGRIGDAPFDAPQLLDAASFYALDTLKDAAVDALRQQTTISESLRMLELALRYNAPLLREHCVTLIRQHNLDVMRTPDWLELSLTAALLLVQETVIESELAVLQGCRAWCLHHCGRDDGDEYKATLAKFLQFIDFTQMSEREIAIAESIPGVPLDALYRAFKHHCLGLPPTSVPRKGGIILQWEMSGDREIELVSNHVRKLSSDYSPKNIFAVNRFSKGRHYFVFQILELRSPHDCLVGVGNRAADRSYMMDPCSMSISSPPGTKVTAEPAAMTSVLVDHCCHVGVLLDFVAQRVQWINHRTKKLLFTAEPAPSDDDGDAADGRGLLPTPMMPCTMLLHKSNGGVTLSETTTFLDERASLRDAAISGGPGGATGSNASPQRGTPKKQRSFH